MSADLKQDILNAVRESHSEIFIPVKQHEAEIQEYHDFLEDLCDFLIWDTGKRAREARYKIEAFLKRMDEKND